MIQIFAAFLLLKVFDFAAYQVAKYVEDHTNFTTGNTRLKARISAALWWLA